VQDGVGQLSRPQAARAKRLPDFFSAEQRYPTERNESVTK